MTLRAATPTRFPKPTLDASSTSGWQTITVASFVVTFAHTVSGDKRVLVVFTNTRAPTGITYAGVAMTRSSIFGTTMTAWYLVAPATGTNNVVVTYAVPPGDRSVIIAAHSFKRINQSSPAYSTSNLTSSAATSFAISLFNSQPLNVIFGVLLVGTTGITSVNGTRITEQTLGGTTFLVDYRIVPENATQEISWTWTTSVSCEAVGYEIIHDALYVGTPPRIGTPTHFG